MRSSSIATLISAVIVASGIVASPVLGGDELRVATLGPVGPEHQAPPGGRVDPGNGERGIHLTGEFELNSGFAVDLDSGRIDVSRGDIRLLTAGGDTQLLPVGDARWLPFRVTEWDYTECFAAIVGHSSPVPISDLSLGDYICIKTDADRISAVRIDSVRPLLRRISGTYRTWER